MNDNEAVLSGNVRDAVAALKRERIVIAAVELFYANGYEGTTLEAVGERLGVTKPFIYSYFKSKTELLAEICARGIGSSLRVINRVVETRGSPGEMLAAFGREFVMAVLENQGPIAIFTREEKNLEPKDLKRINEMRREFDRKLTALLDAGVAAGEFEIADTRIASLMIGGMVSWAYVWYRPAGRLGLDDVAERVTELILAMVRRRPATVRPARAAAPKRAARPPRRGART
jgi:AcrR family transcriptional regulator